MSEVNEIKENIKKLNLGQISELIEGLKKDLNIQETAVVQPVAAAASEKPEEKEVSNVSVQWVGKKEGSELKGILDVIRKAIKELKGEEIGLRQALTLINAEGDKIILEDVPRDKVEGEKGIIKQLAELGAEVKIK